MVKPKRMEASSWLGVMRRRLPEQGVVFVLHDEVKGYLDTEGAYWIESHGRTGKWHQTRKPSFGESMLRRSTAPPLSLARKLALREPVHHEAGP